MEREWQEKMLEMCGQPMELIIAEQNICRPVERWENLIIMLPTRYLAAMVNYFVYAEADPKRTVMNKVVMDLFQATCIESSLVECILEGAMDLRERSSHERSWTNVGKQW